MNKIKKYIYIIVGLLSLVFGAIGIVIPVLPTTPLLLLASYCFAKGSDRFNNWFIGTKIYKNHLKSFVEDKTMTLKEKISIVSFAYSMLLITLFTVDKLIVRIVIPTCMLIIFYYFKFVIKTVTQEEKELKKSVRTEKDLETKDELKVETEEDHKEK